MANIWLQAKRYKTSPDIQVVNHLIILLRQALLDARMALEHDPKSLKAHHRQAQAQLGLGKYRAAMLTARAGERLLNMKADRQSDFGSLMNQIAMAGVVNNDYSGFDGRTLTASYPSLL